MMIGLNGGILDGVDGELHRDDAIDPASTSNDNGTASNSKSLGFGHLRISTQTVLTKHSAWVSVGETLQLD